MRRRAAVLLLLAARASSRNCTIDDVRHEDGQVKFKNYYHTQAFVNAVAYIAHCEDHHPDITFGYNQCTIELTTHAINGLSDNDFISAAKEHLSAVAIGHQMDADTQMGPVVSDIQRQRVLGYLEKGTAEGAEVLLEGGAASPLAVDARRGAAIAS